MNTEIIKTLSNDKYRSVNNGVGYITMFTPTFNRAHFLERIYQMLLQQTSSNFVWIIVNDGSQDDTDAKAEKIIADNSLPVLYIYKNNGGKHSAFKIALDNCKTEFFQCMDDDDLYSSDSVKFYINAWNEIKAEQKKEIGAIRTIARYKTSGKFVSNKPDLIPTSKTEDISTLEMNYVKKHHQENWTCYRTDALRSVDLFPKDYWLSEAHTFFSESIWQSRFARKYKCRYIYISLREYTYDADISISRANKSRQHYMNMFINQKIILDEQFDYISRNYISLLKGISIIQILRGYLGISCNDLLSNTTKKSLKVLYFLSAPLSLFGNTIIKFRSKPQNNT